MQYKIFVSYSTHDIDQVELLRQQLSGTPISVFVAEHSVQPTENLNEKISLAIEDCDLFVVLWSKNAKDSDWVSQEIGRAGALKKKILPLVLTKDLQLPAFLSSIKYLPVYEDTTNAIAKAREFIVDSYNKKAQIATKKQKDNDTLALVGIGAFLLWAFSK